MENFLKANGCKASKEEWEALKQEKQGELTDEALAGVAGGLIPGPAMLSPDDGPALE